MTPFKFLIVCLLVALASVGVTVLLFVISLENHKRKWCNKYLTGVLNDRYTDELYFLYKQGYTKRDGNVTFDVRYGDNQQSQAKGEISGNIITMKLLGDKLQGVLNDKGVAKFRRYKGIFL